MTAKNSWWRTYALSALMLAAGLVLAVGSISYKWHLSDKKADIRVRGADGTARVLEVRESARGRASMMSLQYELSGNRHQVWVLCGGGGNCDFRPGDPIKVKIDPVDPQRILTENGKVSGSVSFWNSWTTVPIGIVATLVGGVALGFLIWGNRRSRRHSISEGSPKE